MYKFLVVVVSDRVYSGEAEDVSGARAVEIIRDKNYVVEDKIVVPNRFRDILKIIQSYRDVDVIVFIGGTGPSPRDVTVDAIESIAWRWIPGFGEYFRSESFKQIGYRGLLSRSELFLLGDGRAVLVLPGSPDAVVLGLNIFLEIVDHLLEEARRFEKPHR